MTAFADVMEAHGDRSAGGGIGDAVDGATCGGMAHEQEAHA